jgi:hypothetical protein
MCRALNSILALTAAAGVTGFVGMSSRPFSPASVEGVWRPTEVTITGPGARTITPVQPSLAIITAKHYSRVEIHSSAPRPNVRNAAVATAEELRQAWGPVVAEAGTYETSAGGTLTLHPVVAKSPATTEPGTFFAYRYRVAGDTLWLTPQRDHRGAVANPPTIKLTRVE